MDGTDRKKSFFYNGVITFGLIEFRIIHFDDVMKFFRFKKLMQPWLMQLLMSAWRWYPTASAFFFPFIFSRRDGENIKRGDDAPPRIPHLMMGLSHSLTRKKKKKKKTVNAVVMCKPACVLETLLIVAVLQPGDVLRYLQRKLKKTQNQSKKTVLFIFLRDETWCCWTIWVFSSFPSLKVERVAVV